MEQKSKGLIYVLSALLPFICMILIYGFLGIYPFGDRTILVMDMNGQYSDFLMYFRQVLTGEASIFYSFTKEMGGNVFGLFSYYFSSPFNLILLFFSQETLPEALALITMLKISACGLTFSIFLKHRFLKTDLSVVICSTAYALMTYSMHYGMCIMWLDGVIWLPIVMLGVERILQDKSPVLFILSYAAAVLSNYYTAYMIAVFAAVYFFYRCACGAFEGGKRGFFKRFFIIVLSGLTGVLLMAWLLWPSFVDILRGKLSGAGYVAEGFWNIDIFQIPRRMFIGQYDSITNNGNPNIFCGVLIGLLVFVYFFHSEIKWREKAASLSVFAIFFASFFIKRLDMAWHIFQYPNWYPYRYAFAFNFFAVMLAYRGFTLLCQGKKGRISLAVFAYIGLLSAVYVGQNAALTNLPLARLTIAAAVIYGAMVFALSKGRWKQQMLLCFLVLTAAELVLNGYTTLTGLNNQFPYESRTQYEEQVSAIRQAVETVKDIDAGLYRMEKTFSRSNNDSMSFGYNGMTHYSSTYNGEAVSFNNKMGMLQEYVLIRYLGSTMATDSLLGVKYIVAKESVAAGYESVAAGEDYEIFENPAALPMVFAAPQSVTITPAYGSDYLENQDLFAQSILGQSYLHKVEGLQVDDATGEGFFTTSTGGTFYLELPQKYGGGITLWVNGQQVPYNYDSQEKKIFCMGDYSAATFIRIGLNNGVTCRDVQIYRLDTEAFMEACKEKAKSDGIQIHSFGNSYLEGAVSVEEGEILFTTIPYEEGFKAYIDGAEAKTGCAQNLFLTVECEASAHMLRLEYHTPGFREATVVSAGAFLLLFVYIFVKNRKIKKTC